MSASARVIADLKDLAKRTSNERGAQRLCWGPIWRDARAWFTDKVGELGLTVERDAVDESIAGSWGEVLEALLEHVIEHPEDNTRDALLMRARQLCSAPA